MIFRLAAAAVAASLALGCNSSNSGPDGGATDALHQGVVDAGDMDADSSLGASAAGIVSEASADAGPFCTQPLGLDAGPSTLDDLPLAQWCAPPYTIVGQWQTPCGGLIAVGVGEGADCGRQYLFDATSRRLVAITHGCNGIEACVEGVSGSSVRPTPTAASSTPIAFPLGTRFACAATQALRRTDARDEGPQVANFREALRNPSPVRRPLPRAATRPRRARHRAPPPWRVADADDKHAIKGTRFVLQKNPWNLTDVEQGKSPKCSGPTDP
jgi:hypothetical protein